MELFPAQQLSFRERLGLAPTPQEAANNIRDFERRRRQEQNAQGDRYERVSLDSRIKESILGLINERYDGCCPIAHAMGQRIRLYPHNTEWHHILSRDNNASWNVVPVSRQWHRAYHALKPNSRDRKKLDLVFVELLLWLSNPRINPWAYV